MSLLLIIIAPALVSTVETGRDLYCDTTLIRTVTLKTELGHLRTGLIRRSERLEHYLESKASHEDGDSPTKALESLDKSVLLGKLNAPHFSPPVESYWALTDPDGNVILHSSGKQSSKINKLSTAWDDDKQTDLGDDVVKVQQTPLTGDRAAYDVFLPLYIHGQWIGNLHSGLDAASFDQRIVNEQRTFLLKRSWLVALLLLVNAGAIGALIYCTRRYSGFQSDLSSRDERERRKLTQLGYGLAHEIRNPLHAIRLNTHTLRRSLAGKALSEQEMNDMMRESCDEIDRIDALMRSLVQYVSPQTTEAQAELELNREAQAILQLQSEELRRKKIEVAFDAENTLFVVQIIPSQLRALLHELFTFAQRSAGEGGKIEIRLREVNRIAELVITDGGRPLSPRDLENLFEPFHATPYSEAGLTLALVRQHAKKSGGTLIRKQSQAGNQFELRLPLIHSSQPGTHT